MHLCAYKAELRSYKSVQCFLFRNITVHKRCKTQISLLKIVKPYAQKRKISPLFFHPVQRISEVISLFHTIKSEKGGRQLYCFTSPSISVFNCKQMIGRYILPLSNINFLLNKIKYIKYSFLILKLLCIHISVINITPKNETHSHIN